MHTGRQTRGFWRHLWDDDGGWLPLVLAASGALGSIFGRGAQNAAQGRMSEAQLNVARDRNSLDAWRTANSGELDRWKAGEEGTVGRWLAENAGNLGRADLKQSGVLSALGLGERGTMDRAGLDLARRQFALDAPSTRARQALTGDMLARGRNVSISHPRATIPQISGGYTFNDMGPDVRQAGSAMSRQALMGMLKGDQFDPVPMQDFMGSLPEIPGMTPTPDMAGIPGMTPAPGNTPSPSPSGWERFMSIAGNIGNIMGAIQPFIKSPYQEYHGPNG